MAKLERRLHLVLNGLLLLANLVALNFLVRPVSARIDLTEEKLYTISDVTRRTLADLPDRIELYGYFSQETHEKLAPLVPKIRDLAEELRQISHGKLEVTFLDPRGDEAAEKDAAQRFGVRPTPFMLQSKYESGVRSAYFDIVLAYGDVHEHLGYQDMIEVEAKGPDVEVRLRNLEYQLVSAIRKLTREFGSLEARLMAEKAPARVTFFITPAEKFPGDEAKGVRDFLAKKRTLVDGAVADLAKRFKAGVKAEVLDPTSGEESVKEALRRYGARPVRLSYASQETFYLDGYVELEGKAERIDLRDHPDQELTRYELVQAVESSMRRLVPGALPRVGLVTPRPDIPPDLLMQMRMRGQQLPPDPFQRLKSELGRSYEVRDVDLKSGKPPIDVDVLLVLGPRALDEKAQFAFDQFLMLGGKAVVCLDRTEVDFQASRYGGLRLKEVEPGLDAVLEKYGVSVRKELVLDDQNYAYPLPVVREVQGFRIESIERVPYPWFLLARGDAIDRTNPITGKVAELALLWPSPIAIDPEKTKGLRVTTLVRSSDKAWTTADLRAADPKLGADGGKGYVVPEKTAREAVAVAIEGSLTSAFKDGKVPTGTATPMGGLEPTFQSPAGTRLVVVGDAEFASDLGAQVLGEGFSRSVQFVTNLCDWALADEDMIRMRARGTAERRLAALGRDEKMKIEVLNYIAPIGLVVLAGALRALLRRRSQRRVRA
jgi:ABC-2 type transport system permease protein